MPRVSGEVLFLGPQARVVEEARVRRRARRLRARRRRARAERRPRPGSPRSARAAAVRLASTIARACAALHVQLQHTTTNSLTPYVQCTERSIPP